MARRRPSNRRRHRGSLRFLYKLVSFLAICGAIIAAITLFFRVEHVTVMGQQRYTEEQIRDASGIQNGDNLYLLNKHEAAEKIVNALPYIQKTRINRKLPDTLMIEVEESGTPVVLIQDGAAWLIDTKGKIVEQAAVSEAEEYGQISGCTLLAPSVGTKIALSTEFSIQQESLLALLGALEEAEMLEQMDGIRLNDISVMRMDYIDRFTVEMPYGADYELKLKILRQALASEKVQDNMTGTFDMTREDGKVYLDQTVR